MIYNLKMDQNHEGTLVSMKQGNKKLEAAEQSNTGNHLSGMSQSGQNPQGKESMEEKTSKSEQIDQKKELSNCWEKHPTLKKWLKVWLIIFFVLLIFSLAFAFTYGKTSPKVKLKKTKSVSIPSSSQTIQRYNAEATKSNLFSSNQNKTFTISTVTTKTARLLQSEADANLDNFQAVAVSFNYLGTGISAVVTSLEDIQIHINPDQMVNYYFEKKLEKKKRMLATMGQDQTTQGKTQSQKEGQSSENNKIIDGLKQSVASIISDSFGEGLSISISESETVDLMEKEDGTVTLYPIQNSRLLQEFSKQLRMLQTDWSPLLHDMTTSVLKPVLTDIQQTLQTFFTDLSALQGEDSNQFKEILKSSNFGDVDILVNEEESPIRLLQSSDSSTSSKTNNKQNKIADKKGKNKNFRPLNRNRRGKKHQKKISEEAFTIINSCIPDKNGKIVCKAQVIERQKSPYKTDKKTRQDSKKVKKSRFSFSSNKSRRQNKQNQENRNRNNRNQNQGNRNQTQNQGNRNQTQNQGNRNQNQGNRNQNQGNRNQNQGNRNQTQNQGNRNQSQGNRNQTQNQGNRNQTQNQGNRNQTQNQGNRNQTQNQGNRNQTQNQGNRDQTQNQGNRSNQNQLNRTRNQINKNSNQTNRNSQEKQNNFNLNRSESNENSSNKYENQPQSKQKNTKEDNSQPNSQSTKTDKNQINGNNNTPSTSRESSDAKNDIVRKQSQPKENKIANNSSQNSTPKDDQGSTQKNQPTAINNDKPNTNTEKNLPNQETKSNFSYKKSDSNDKNNDPKENTNSTRENSNNNNQNKTSNSNNSPSSNTSANSSKDINISENDLTQKANSQKGVAMVDQISVKKNENNNLIGDKNTNTEGKKGSESKNQGVSDAGKPKAVNTAGSNKNSPS